MFGMKYLYRFLILIPLLAVSNLISAQICDLSGLQISEYTTVENVFETVGEPDSLTMETYSPVDYSTTKRVFRRGNYDNVFEQTRLVRDDIETRLTFHYKGGVIDLVTVDLECDSGLYEMKYCFYCFSLYSKGELVLGAKCNGVGVRVGDTMESLKQFIFSSKDESVADVMKMEQAPFWLRKEHSTDKKRCYDMYPGRLSDSVWLVYEENGIITGFYYEDRLGY